MQKTIDRQDGIYRPLAGVAERAAYIQCEAFFIVGNSKPGLLLIVRHPCGLPARQRVCALPSSRQTHNLEVIYYEYEASITPRSSPRSKFLFAFFINITMD